MKIIEVDMTHVYVHPIHTFSSSSKRRDRRGLSSLKQCPFLLFGQYWLCFLRVSASAESLSDVTLTGPVCGPTYRPHPT